MIDFCQRCRLRTLEWGGDVLVPVGNLERSVEVGRLTRAAGLAITAYRSHCRLAVSSETGPPF